MPISGDTDLAAATTSTTTSNKWGDVADEYYDDDDQDEIPPIQVIGPDKNGIKQVIEVRKDEKGNLVKVTTKFQQKKQKTKLTHAEVERKHWKKFGASAGSPPGPDPAQTLVADEVFLTLTTKSSELDDVSNNTSNTGAGGSSADSLKKLVVCRLCKGDHWTNKCPYKDKLGAIDSDKSDSKDEKSADAASSGKYIPPSMRAGARREGGSADSGSRGGSDRGDRNKDDATIRVTNLSDDTNEDDLYDMFKRFGPITRTFLARDKNTNTSKGFAFISFVNKSDAAAAIEAKNGQGHNYLILNVEWAKPSSH